MYAPRNYGLVRVGVTVLDGERVLEGVPEGVKDLEGVFVVDPVIVVVRVREGVPEEVNDLDGVIVVDPVIVVVRVLDGVPDGVMDGVLEPVGDLVGVFEGLRVGVPERLEVIDGVAVDVCVGVLVAEDP